MIFKRFFRSSFLKNCRFFCLLSQRWLLSLFLFFTRTRAYIRVRWWSNALARATTGEVLALVSFW